MLEDSLIQWLNKHPVFKAQDLKVHLNSERMTYIKLKRLIEEGKIKKLPFKLYGRVDDHHELVASIEDVACSINKKAYIMGLYACKFHSLISEDIDTIIIGLEKALKSAEIEGVILKTKKEVLTKRLIEVEGRRYTDYCDTILDMVEHLDKWLSVENLITILENAHALETSEILMRLKERNKQILYQKCGLLAELGILKVTNKESFVKTCVSQIGRSNRFFSKEAREKGTYIKKWQMLVTLMLAEKFKDIVLNGK